MWKSACVLRICSVATFSGIPTAQIMRPIHVWDVVETGNVPKVKTVRRVRLTVRVMRRLIVSQVSAREFVEMGNVRWAKIAPLALWIVVLVQEVVVLPTKRQVATPFLSVSVCVTRIPRVVRESGMQHALKQRMHVAPARGVVVRQIQLRVVTMRRQKHVSVSRIPIAAS